MAVLGATEAKRLISSKEIFKMLSATELVGRMKYKWKNGRLRKGDISDCISVELYNLKPD